MRQAVVASSLDLLKGFLPKGRIFREQPGNVGLVYKWARVVAPRRTEGAPRLKTERSLAPRLRRRACLLLSFRAWTMCVVVISGLKPAFRARNYNRA